MPVCDSSCFINSNAVFPPGEVIPLDGDTTLSFETSETERRESFKFQVHDTILHTIHYIANFRLTVEGCYG